jgi:hypothetical protein
MSDHEDKPYSVVYETSIVMLIMMLLLFWILNSRLTRIEQLIVKVTNVHHPEITGPTPVGR